MAKLLPNQSDFYHGGVVEGGIFVTEEIAEGVADKVGVADRQVGEMMGMTVDPCRDSTVCDIVAEFGCVSGI